MAYDQYAKIPQDLRPTQADELACHDLAYLIKEAARLRHDFHYAVEAKDRMDALKRAFTPAILHPEGPPPERHGRLSSDLESEFARSYRPDAKTVKGIAREHARFVGDAQLRVAAVRGNAKLAVLMKEKLKALTPDIGYSAAGGALRRLRKDDASIIKAFHPLGVGDLPTIITLMLNVKPGQYHYWWVGL